MNYKIFTRRLTEQKNKHCYNLLTDLIDDYYIVGTYDSLNLPSEFNTNGYQCNASSHLSCRSTINMKPQTPYQCFKTTTHQVYHSGPCEVRALSKSLKTKTAIL